MTLAQDHAASWVPDASLIASLQSVSACSGINLIPAGPGDVIPPAVPVIIFPDSGDATVLYNFEDLVRKRLRGLRAAG